MRIPRPTLGPRSVTEPPRALQAPPPPHGSTLRTLEMLKAMGYRQVWCRASEIDDEIIASASQEGWQVASVQGERIKFSLGDQVVPVQDTPRGRPLPSRSPSEASIRTTSPTRLPDEPRPSPLARMRRVSSETRRPTSAQSTVHPGSEDPDLVVFDSRPSVCSPLLVNTEPLRPSARRPLTRVDSGPAVVVSPPADDGCAEDYFAYLPMIHEESDDIAVPMGSALWRRQQVELQRVADGEASPESVYSIDALAEDLFIFDTLDPYVRASPSDVPRSPSLPLSGQASPSALAGAHETAERLRAYLAEEPFRPLTPELNVSRGSTTAADADADLPSPTFVLTRMKSAPEMPGEQGPQFDLRPSQRPLLSYITSYLGRKSDG